MNCKTCGNLLGKIPNTEIEEKESVYICPCQKEKILEPFSKIEIHTCTMCGEFLGKEEFTKGEGVCFKHWDN